VFSGARSLATSGAAALLLGHPVAVGAAAPSEGDPSDWSLHWDYGLRIERDDEDPWLSLGGRLLLDGAIIHADAGIVHAKEPGETNVVGQVRQVRLRAQGGYQRAFFKFEYDFAPKSATFTDVFIGANGLGPVGTLKLGHMKEPFSLEQQTSRLHMTFMERSLANALAHRRNTGGGVRNTALDDRIRWRIGAFCDTQEFEAGCEEDWNLTFRVTGLPVYADEGAKLLEVGASYSHQFRNSRSASISQRPESNLANRYLQTGTIDGVRSADRIGAEVAWVRGPLSAQAELLYAFLDRDTGGGDLDFWGAYAQASWFLTGEFRPYSRASGAFGRIVPRHRFDPAAGHWGAVQVAARVSHVDLDDADVRGGRETDLTLGLNWYLFSILRLAVNYVYGHVHDQGDAHIAQARLQIDF